MGFHSLQRILLQPTVQNYASMNVCTRRLHENLQKNETKTLIVLKKACCHFPQKNVLTMPFLCLKKCVFKVKNVSLVSLHLFYYLSDNIIIMISSLLYEILFYQMLKISTQKFPGCVF